ncbi:MAG: hypothetical protein ACP5F1_06550, partial [Thermoplasmata archaeon]
MTRNNIIKVVAISVVLLFLISGFSVMVYGNLENQSTHFKGAYSFLNYTPFLESSNLSKYNISNIYYYPNYNSTVLKVISTSRGFYIVGNDLILFKSPKLQIPLKTTPGWGYFYSSAFVDKYGIWTNDSIYILGNGMYYNGGGGLFIWRIFVKNGTLGDYSFLIPKAWTKIGNNMFWLGGALGGSELALVEDNYNQTICNITLIKNNSIYKIITNPFGFTGTNQWSAMAYANNSFLFLSNLNGNTFAILIYSNGTVKNVSNIFSNIWLLNSHSGIIGVGNNIIIASGNGNTYVFDPGSLKLININNPIKGALITYYNDSNVIIAGVQSNNFTLEMFNTFNYSITKIFSTPKVSLLNSIENFGAIGLGYYNGTILLAGPFPDPFGPLTTINLNNIEKGNITFNIYPKNAWLTIDRCLCVNSMAQIALPLVNGTFKIKNAIYGEYYIYVEDPGYEDYYGPLYLNLTNMILNITLQRGTLNYNSSYPWIPIGPHNITIQFLNDQIAQYSAHIGLFAINGKNPEIIYAASSVAPGMTGPIGDGGIFKTYDGGKDWFPIDFGLPFGTITGLYINQSNPNQLITGVSKSGIFMTDDGGGYWYKVSNFTDAIDISYGDGKLFAGTDQGIIESNDSGYSWSLIEPTNVEVNSISISGNVIYALLNNLSLMKSTNFGISWNYIYKFIGYYPYTVRVSPFNSSILYVTIGGGEVYTNSITEFTSVPTFYSNDGGKSFTPVPVLPVKTVVFDPLNSSILWAVGYPDLYSFNGGQSFYATFLTVDNMGIYVDPVNDSILLAGSDQGMYESNDKGVTWYPINGNIIDELSDAISIVPNGSRIIVSMQDLGQYMTYNGGNSWFASHAGPENSLVFINPGNSSWVYSLDRLFTAPLRVSNDSGISYEQNDQVNSSSYLTGNEIFAVNSTDGSHVLIGTQFGLYYSKDFGKKWILLNGSPKNITSLDYVSNNEIIVGTLNGVYVFNGNYWVKSNGISQSVNSISIDPENKNIVAASVGLFKGKLYLSYDGGYNFSMVNTSIDNLFIGGILDFAIPVQFYFLNTTNYPLIATTNYGIYLSENLGKSWNNISYNLYSGQVDDLQFENNNLYIATYGGGLEEIKNFSVSSLPGTVFGNVFSNINITLNGNPVKTYDGHFKLFLKPGTYTFLLSGSYLLKFINLTVSSMGVYYINMTTNVTFIERGLPNGTNWSVELNGIKKSSRNDSITFNVLNLFSTYKIPIINIFKSNQTSGFLTNLTWPNNTIFITFSPCKLYNVYFNETGLLNGSIWKIEINGNGSYYSQNNILKISLINGSYSFTAYSNGYFSYPSTENFVVNGKNVYINLEFYLYALENISSIPTLYPGWEANVYTNGNSFIITGDPLTYYNGDAFIHPYTPGEGFYISASWNGKYFLLVGQKWATEMGAYAAIYYPYNNTLINVSNMFPQSLNKSVILRSVDWNGSEFMILGDYLSSSPGLTLLFEYNPENGSMINLTYILPSEFTRVQDCCTNPLEEILSINGTFYISIENQNGLLIGKVLNNKIIKLNITFPSGFNLYYTNHDFMFYSGNNLFFYGSSNSIGPEILMLNISTLNIEKIPVTFNINSQITSMEIFNDNIIVSLRNQNSNKNLLYIILGYNETAMCLNVTSLIPSSWQSFNGISLGDNELFLVTDLINTNKEMVGIIPINSKHYNVKINILNCSNQSIDYVNLSNGQSFVWIGNVITFPEINGTYKYSALIIISNLSYEFNGTLILNGTNVNITIAIKLKTYNVTFIENGLPSGTTWYVNLSNGQSYSSS